MAANSGLFEVQAVKYCLAKLCRKYNSYVYEQANRPVSEGGVVCCTSTVQITF